MCHEEKDGSDEKTRNNQLPPVAHKPARKTAPFSPQAPGDRFPAKALAELGLDGKHNGNRRKKGEKDAESAKRGGYTEANIRCETLAVVAGNRREG